MVVRLGGNTEESKTGQMFEQDGNRGRSDGEFMGGIFRTPVCCILPFVIQPSAIPTLSPVFFDPHIHMWERHQPYRGWGGGNGQSRHLPQSLIPIQKGITVCGG